MRRKKPENGSCDKLRDMADLESPSLVYGLLQRQLSNPVPGRVPPSFEAFAENRLLDKRHVESRCELPGIARSTFLMVFSPDGKKIASTHGNHNVYITDVKTGKNLNTLSGHPRTPWCIAFHPSSNQILATGCLGGQVRVWDLHGGSEMWMTRGETVIASLVFHPVDHMLVIATYNELYFWDWSKPAPFAKCHTANEKEKVRYVSFDESGHRLVTGISNMQPYMSQWDRVGPEEWNTAMGNEEEGGRSRLLTPHFRALLAHYEQLMERLPPLRPASLVDRGTDPMEVEPGSSLPGEPSPGRSDAPSQPGTSRTDNRTDGLNLLENFILRGHRFRDTILDCYNITREADDIIGQLRRHEQPHRNVEVNQNNPFTSTDVSENAVESSSACREEVLEDQAPNNTVESTPVCHKEVLEEQASNNTVESTPACCGEVLEEQALDNALESNAVCCEEVLEEQKSGDAAELSSARSKETLKEGMFGQTVGLKVGGCSEMEEEQVSHDAVDLNLARPEEVTEGFSEDVVESNTGGAVKRICTAENYGSDIRNKVNDEQIEDAVLSEQCQESEPRHRVTNSARVQAEQSEPEGSRCHLPSTTVRCGARQSELQLLSLHRSLARTIFLLEQACMLRDQNALTGDHRKRLFSALLQNFKEQKGTGAALNCTEQSSANVISSDEIRLRNYLNRERVSENLASLLMAEDASSEDEEPDLRFIQKSLRTYVGGVIAKLNNVLTALLSDPYALSSTVDQELIAIQTSLHRMRTLYVRSSLIRDSFNEASDSQSSNSGRENTIHLIDRASNEISALRSKKGIAKTNPAERPYVFNSGLFERLRTLFNPGSLDANKSSENDNDKSGTSASSRPSLVLDEDDENKESSGSEDPSCVSTTTTTTTTTTATTSVTTTTTQARFGDAGACEGYPEGSALVDSSTDTHYQREALHKNNSAETVGDHSGEVNVVDSTVDGTPSDSNEQNTDCLDLGYTSDLLSSRSCANVRVLEIHEETEMLIKLLHLVRSVVAKIVRISEQASNADASSSTETLREGESSIAGESSSDGEVEPDTSHVPSLSGSNLRARALAADEEAINLMSKVWNWRTLHRSQSCNVSSPSEVEEQHAWALFELSLINLEVKMVANKVHELLSTHGGILGVSMPSHWGYAVNDARSNVSTQFREWKRISSRTPGSNAGSSVDASTSNQDETLDNSAIQQEISKLNDKINSWVEHRAGGSSQAGPSRARSELGEGTSGFVNGSNTRGTGRSVGEKQAQSSGTPAGTHNKKRPFFVSKLRELISDRLRTASSENVSESTEERSTEPAPERSHRGGWTYFPRRLRPEERLYVSPRSAFQPHVRRPQAASEEGSGLAHVEQSIDRLSRNLDDTLRICRARLEVLELYQLQNLWEELRTHIRSLRERVRALREASRMRTDAAVAQHAVQHSNSSAGSRQGRLAANSSPAVPPRAVQHSNTLAGSRQTLLAADSSPAVPPRAVQHSNTLAGSRQTQLAADSSPAVPPRAVQHSNTLAGSRQTQLAANSSPAVPPRAVQHSNTVTGSRQGPPAANPNPAVAQHSVPHSNTLAGSHQGLPAASSSPVLERPARPAKPTSLEHFGMLGRSPRNLDHGEDAGPRSRQQSGERSGVLSHGARAAMGNGQGSSRIVHHLCSVMSRMNRRLSVSRRHCPVGTRSLDSRHGAPPHRRSCSSLRVQTYFIKMCPNRGSRTERPVAGDRGGRSQVLGSRGSTDQARGESRLWGGVRGVKRRAEDANSQLPPVRTPAPTEANSTNSSSSQQPFLTMIRRLEALVLRHDEQQHYFQRELARLRSSAARQRGTADDDLYELLQLALQITGCLLTQLVNSSRRMESIADGRQQEVGARRQRTFMVPSVRVNDVPLSEAGSHSPPPRRMSRLSSPPPPIALRFQHLYGDSSPYVRPRFLHPRYVAWPDPFSTDPDNVYLGPPVVIRADLTSPQTHRIQVWDFSEYFIPDISKADENVVVSECKIHNDASVDISRDGSMLVALLPSDHYENVTNTLGIYSLLPESRGQCLYTTNFEQNAVSVSFSPTGRHLLIGVAINRATLLSTDSNFLARIYRLSGTRGSAKGRLFLVHNFERTREHAYMSVNCIRWLPTAGQGFVYGTNTGQLRILR